ncbi:hypothetical protein JOF55_000363 [Haloactinomyces albus]|uniref:Uncharacterized protein n=1 Tax=Haloactinomyces albus TaxID=1352928 RepID=A0AAE3Z894_9ACTN|nr:hypothetical protein [Haloactinomyces albus]
MRFGPLLAGLLRCAHDCLLDRGLGRLTRVESTSPYCRFRQRPHRPGQEPSWQSQPTACPNMRAHLHGPWVTVEPTRWAHPDLGADPPSRITTGPTGRHGISDPSARIRRSAKGPRDHVGFPRHRARQMKSKPPKRKIIRRQRVQQCRRFRKMKNDVNNPGAPAYSDAPDSQLFGTGRANPSALLQPAWSPAGETDCPNSCSCSGMSSEGRRTHVTAALATANSTTASLVRVIHTVATAFFLPSAYLTHLRFSRAYAHARESSRNTSKGTTFDRAGRGWGETHLRQR